MRLSALLFISLFGLNTTAQVELRKKIVVIDSPISEAQLNAPYMCKDGSVSIDPEHRSYNARNETVPGIYRHGENVVGIIGARIDSQKYCIYHIAFYFMDHLKAKSDRYKAALLKTVEIPNIVGLNLSIAQGNEQTDAYVWHEEVIVGAMALMGVKIVAAAGNEHIFLSKKKCNVYPACLKLKLDEAAAKNFYVVGSSTHGIHDDGQVMIYSNLSDDLDMQMEDGTLMGTPSMIGTSQAAAVFTGKLFSR